MTKAIQVRIDAKLKKQADLVFYDLGLDTPTAIRLFLKKVVLSQSIPFELKVTKTDNGFSPEFENLLLEAAKEKEQFGPFKSAKDAISALHQYAAE